MSFFLRGANSSVYPGTNAINSFLLLFVYVRGAGPVQVYNAAEFVLVVVLVPQKKKVVEI